MDAFLVTEGNGSLNLAVLERLHRRRVIEAMMARFFAHQPPPTGLTRSGMFNQDSVRMHRKL